MLFLVMTALTNIGELFLNAKSLIIVIYFKI